MNVKIGVKNRENWSSFEKLMTDIVGVIVGYVLFIVLQTVI